MATHRRLVVGMIVAGGVLVAATAVVGILNPTLTSLPPVMHEPRVPDVGVGPPAPSIAPPTTPAASPTATRSRRPPPPPPNRPAPTTVAPPVDAPVVLLSFEAEDPRNDLDGSADRFRFDGASGGRVVGYLGRVFGGTPGRLRFLAVRVPAAGTYRMTVHYTGSEDRVAVISVNGAALPGVAFRRSSGIATMDVSVRLTAGSNRIEFGNPTGRCPAIDRIVLAA